MTSNSATALMLEDASEITLRTVLMETLRDPLNREVIESLARFADTIKAYGYYPPIHSLKSLLRLQELDVEKKRQIRDHFQDWRQWIQPLSSETELDQSREHVFAKRALRSYGMHLDENFWTTVGPNDVVEIYGHDMIQLYRSLTFFQYCGYSLLDISVFEWYVLWDRPRIVIEKMTEYAQNYLTSHHECSQFDIPKHVLRETMDTGLTTPFKVRACLVEFKNIASLKKGIFPKPGGFICSATGSVIAEGSEALNIQFI